MTAANEGAERRRHERRPAGHVHASIPPGTAFTPMELTTRDLTEAGIGLVLLAKLGVGTVLPLRLRAAGGEVDVQARVVYTEAAPDGRWLTGCAFERPLTADELRRLG